MQLLNISHEICGISFYKILHKGKGEVHPCTDTQALYRPYDPQGEWRYSSTIS